MPIDTSIIGRLQQPNLTQPDPVERYGKIAQLQALMQQGDLQGVQLDQARKAQADDASISEAYKGGGDTNSILARLKAQGQYKAAQAIEKNMLEKDEKTSSIRKNNASADKSELDQKLDRLSRGASLLNHAKDQTSWDMVKKIGADQGLFDQKAVQSFPAEFNPQFVDALKQGGITQAQQLEQAHKDATLAETERNHKVTEGQTAATAPFTMGPDGKPVANAPAQAFALQRAGAGASKTLVNVNSYTPASEEAQKDFMKGLRARFDQLQSAPAVLDNIEKAKSLVPAAKGFVGSGAEQKLAVAKFLNNNLDMNVNVQGVTSAEELRSRLFMGVMENLKKMDSQPSQSQQAALQKALGEIGTDPSALPRVLDVFGTIVKQKVNIHNKEASDSQRLGVKFPYNPIIDLQGGGTQDKAADPAQQAAPVAPKLGERRDGYIYKGGDPANPASWAR